MLTTTPLAVSIAGLTGQPGTLSAPARLDWAAQLGPRAVALDASLPGMRPRELGESARRDLAAALKRRELDLAGIDLWIPASHFASSENADRAISAVGETLTLAADLVRQLGKSSRPIVSVHLPGSESVRESLRAVADRVGATLADHAWPPIEREFGFDPAAVLGAGGDPIDEAGARSAGIIAARLSDLSAGSRALPGEDGGRVDAGAYQAVLSLAKSIAHAVIDLRGVEQPTARAKGLIERWRSPATG
ncbi:MAG: hypothetical protein AAGI17_04855 [Planctomycetota bacterium]